MNKADPVVAALITLGELTLYRHPEKGDRVFASFRRPMFRDEVPSKLRGEHINHEWFRSKSDMMIRYLTNSMKWTADGDQQQMKKVEHRELVNRAKKYAEFWGLLLHVIRSGQMKHGDNTDETTPWVVVRTVLGNEVLLYGVELKYGDHSIEREINATYIRRDLARTRQ